MRDSFKLRSWTQTKNATNKTKKRTRVRFAPIQLQPVDKNSQSIMRVSSKPAWEIEFREFMQVTEQNIGTKTAVNDASAEK